MQLHGFELLEERNLTEIGGTGRLWKHLESGARLLSITNTDENKCFGVSFYTPPTDSTGVAHILEHSVLCGSAKYPVKEPFTELLKGSLQTFLNAFTFPDKTCYPVASANLQDFYNLIDVYLDAVFHPRLTRETFQQEGWHIEAPTPDGPWAFKGVVYNEMKGVYSTPDSVLAEQSQHAVFPDNLYCLDSGGNPEHIPDLTYEAFTDFHHRYYQPGNAMFFFWGDDPEENRLQRIDREISGSKPATDLPNVALQAQPKENTFRQMPYAASKDENRALFTVNWLLPEKGNILEYLRMEMLEHILEGLPGSPLRKALMESGLGEDTTGCGLETDLRQMYYSTGLKGIEPEDAKKVEAIILEALRSLAEKGIEPAAVEAAVNSVEFSLREDNSGRFPRGLAAMVMSLSTWNYGGDPMAPLAWEKPLAEIKSALAKGEKVFEKAITRYFLESPHTCVLLLPDHALGDIRQKAEDTRLSEIQAQCGPGERKKLAEETEKLIEAQLAPDSPEALASIPCLGIRDLPKTQPPVPTEITKTGTWEFLMHPLATRGVAYVSLLLPIPGISPQLVPLLPLFCRSLTECGSALADYSQLGMKIASKTGGLGTSILVGSHLGNRKPFCYLLINGKSVYEKIPDMFELIQEILLTPQTDARLLQERLEVMLLESRARLEQGLQMAGHSAISARLSAHFSGDAAFAEEMHGFSQLQSLSRQIERITADPDSLLQDLEALRGQLVCGKDAIFSTVAEESALPAIKEQAENLLKNMPAQRTGANLSQIAEWPAMKDLPHGEAFITPGQVNYVGKGANLYNLGYVYNGSVNVIMRWLRMGRLWEKVRVAGGAYGAFCTFDRISGTMICASYRDPNVDTTLSAYDGLGEYIKKHAPEGAQLEQAIIGAIGALDTYLLPDARGAQALAWHLSGLTPELRQQTREQIFSTTRKEFLEFASPLEGFAQTGDICVLGGSKTVTAAREHGWTEYKLV